LKDREFMAVLQVNNLTLNLILIIQPIWEI